MTLWRKEFDGGNSLSHVTADRLDTGADWRVLALRIKAQFGMAPRGRNTEMLDTEILDIEMQRRDTRHARARGGRSRSLFLARLECSATCTTASVNFD